MTTDRPAETTVTVAALRALCGAAPGEIETLIRSRALTVRSGRVGLIQGTRAYLDSIRSATKSASLAAAQDASRSARADAAELALAVDDRRLIRQADVDDALHHICGGVMSCTGTIAARATRNVHERRIIEEQIAALQNRIAQAVAGAETVANLDPQPTKKRSRK